MPLSPDLHNFLQKVKDQGFPALHTLTPTAARSLIDQGRYAKFPVAYHPDVLVTHQTLTTPDTNLPIRIYQPSDMTRTYPGIVFYHGGGFTFGTLDGYEDFCIMLSLTTQSVVISVAFRLAPEFPFPTPVEDCYFATTWIAKHLQDYHITDNELFIAGESAGGNLAAVVALMLRDRQSATVKGQILIYPMTDSDFNTASYLQYATANPLLTREDFMWFWQQYTTTTNERLSPYTAPLKSHHLEHLPPALILTATCDPLHDEGAAYAKRMDAAQCLYAYDSYENMCHGFIYYESIIPSAKTATLDIMQRIKKMINAD